MKNTLRNPLLFVALLMSFQVAGQVKEDRRQDRIDEEYNDCLTKDTAYANVCNCAFVAYDKWNKELDVAYKKLLKSLKKESDKAALKTAQNAWVTFKDAEFKAYDNIFNQPGAKWCGLRQDGKIDLVRDRTVQLRSYAEALQK